MPQPRSALPGGPRSTPPRTQHRTPALLVLGVLLALVATLVPAGAPSSAAAAPAASAREAGDTLRPPNPDPDTEVDEATCTLVGRRYLEADQDTPAGCSRDECLIRRARVSGDYNTEVCAINATLYGVPLESGYCRDLGRRWIPVLNRCAQNPERRVRDGERVFLDAAQCRAPATVYVVIRSSLGADICLTPDELDAARAQAADTDATLASGVVDLHEVLCEPLPRRTWDAARGVCRKLADGEAEPLDSSPVFIIGDSVTHRAADDVTARTVDWDVDGQPGTALNSFERRWRAYRATHEEPGTLVIALGANNGVRTRKVAYDRAVAVASPDMHVVFVTPFRSASDHGRDKAKLMRDTELWMKEIARSRPHTCIAPWKAKVEREPGLVVDGVHQSRAAEDVWARLVIRAVKGCR